MAQNSESKDHRKKSTTVRAPWHLRAAFAAAERFAPGPAARVLARLWFKIPGGPEKRLRGPAPAGAGTLNIECLGGEVWGYEWGEGPLVYLVHGWGGSTSDFKFIAASLVSEGYRVVAFDSPSHGNSGPGPWGDRHATGIHMAEAMRAVAEKFGRPHAVVAHSLGSLTAVMGLRRAGMEPDRERMVLIAPFVGGTDGFRDVLDSIVPVGERILSRVVPLAADRAEVDLAEITLKDPVVTAPTLIVHDTWDRPNPFHSNGAVLAETWPNTELMATSGLGHRKVLVSPEVQRRVIRFVNEE